MIKRVGRVSLKNPVLIASWPGMGEVAIRAGSFLKDYFSLQPFARIEATGFFEPTGVTTSKGIISLPHLEEGFFYAYKSSSRRGDFILFLASAQPTLDKARLFAEMVIDFVSSYKVKKVFSFAAMPQPIDHTQPSSVWIAATSFKVLNEFKDYNLKVLKEGQISGLNGLLLGVAKEKGLEGACLLGEIPFYTIQIENPRASEAVLRVLASHLGLKIDFSFFQERASLIEREISRLISYIRGEVSSSAPLSEEDIQRIKSELAKFTTLPQSVKTRIEELFDKASKDLSWTSELKKLLDEWGVYRDYEDRFLNLFKKKPLDN